MSLVLEGNGVRDGIARCREGQGVRSAIESRRWRPPIGSVVLKREDLVAYSDPIDGPDGGVVDAEPRSMPAQSTSLSETLWFEPSTRTAKLTV